MKITGILALAVALLGAMSLVPAAAAGSSDTVNVRIDMSRGVLPSNSVEKAVLKLALDPARLNRRERPPLNLSLVIDRSGSMGGDKMVRAREAAIELVRRLGSEDIVSLVVFDHEVETLVSAQRVGDGRRLVNAIQGISPRGNTALYGGVARGAEEVRKHIEDRRYVSRVILISDGLANVGPSSPSQIAELGNSMARDGITISTVGLGTDYNEDLMTRLAKCGDGNTYFVANSGDLPRILTGEIGDALNVVARRVVIEIEFPAWVKPLNFVGREGRINGRRAELTLSQLYGGQEQFALVEVEISPAPAGSEREVARARVQFEDAVSQKTETVTAIRRVQFSESRVDVIASADKQVEVDYSENMIAKVKDEAIRLVDAGRQAEAAGLMRQRASELTSMAISTSNGAVAYGAANAAKEADRLEREGLDNIGRKAYRTDSANVINQQSTR